MRRCRHQWEEVRRVFLGSRGNVEIERASEEFMREIAFGVTVVELRCSRCGDVTERRLTGRVPATLGAMGR